MGEMIRFRRGLAAAASLSVIAGLLAACSPGPVAPAPVYLRGAAQTPAKVTPPPWRDNTVFTVRHGDTVIDIAHDYHVPLGALIAANQLKTPYLIHPGDRLLIPDGGAPPGDIPTSRMAMTAPPGAPATMPPQMAAIPPSPAPSLPPNPPSPAPSKPPQMAAIPPSPAPSLPPQTITALPSAAPAQIAAASPPPTTPAATNPPRPTPPAQAVTAPPLSPPPTQVAAVTTPVPPPSPQPQTTLPSPQSPPPAKAAAAVVPLDPPAKQLAAIEPAAAVAPPVTTANAGPPSVLAARNPAAALPLPGEAAPAVTLGTQNGRFLWPVHGRILANYGLSTGEAHNQGINIAAPLGTLVRSIDAGAVAYVGNEVKGYGNLVLIKHSNGWISAYAHLDDVIVKKGDTVSAGEVIAKVGDTGGVGEPQLHFELRRGKKPVDPKEFLDPAGSAAVKPAQQAG